MPARTPADIGRDIKQAQQRIVDLKSELADVPPQVLVLSGIFSHVRLEMRATVYDSIEVHGERDGVRTYVGGFDADQAAPLRAWLNHYYPEEAS